MTEDNSDDNIIKVGPLPIEDVYENGQKIRMPVYIKKENDDKYEEIGSINKVYDSDVSNQSSKFVITSKNNNKYEIYEDSKPDNNGFYTDTNNNKTEIKFQIFKKKILSSKNIIGTMKEKANKWFGSKKGGKERSKKKRARRGNMTRGRGGVFTSPRLKEERQSVTQRSRKHKKNRTIRRK